MAVAWQDRPGVRHARPASHPADTDVIKQLALDNQMFEPGDLRDFDEMLRGFFDGSLDGHQWIVAELDGAIAGAAYDPRSRSPTACGTCTSSPPIPTVMEAVSAPR